MEALLRVVRSKGEIHSNREVGDAPLAAPIEGAYTPDMVAAAQLSPGQIVETADQRVILHGVPWTHYEVMLALRGEASVPRMTYLEGALELMSPSSSHEMIKKTIARILEAYALERDLPLNGYGSWTVRSAPKERGLEPDECYVMGERGAKERPDLAIEVIWTSGGLSKLDVYGGLGVPEVWQWKDGVIEVYVLRGSAYAASDRSELLPELDLALVAEYASVTDQTRATREFLGRIRAE